MVCVTVLVAVVVVVGCDGLKVLVTVVVMTDVVGVGQGM
jgi:hypothetical protein